MYTGRLQFEDPGNSPVTGGFQAMLYPTVTLGKHWFAYAAQQIRLSPYLYYDTYDPDHEWYIQTIQAFVGYQIRGEKTQAGDPGRHLAARHEKILARVRASLQIEADCQNENKIECDNHHIDGREPDKLAIGKECEDHAHGVATSPLSC